VITALFIFLAAICKAICDTLQFHFYNSVFKNKDIYFWHPNFSWKNKYKNRDAKQGEAFFGSTTFAVLFTDAWHLFQFCYLTSFFIALVWYTQFDIISNPMLNLIANFAIYKSLFTIVFELSYRKLLL
jgi:hypothetical protein